MMYTVCIIYVNINNNNRVHNEVTYDVYSMYNI